MFAGIIEEIGRIERLDRSGGGARLRIGAGLVLEGTKPGDSLAVDGVCLTVEALDEGFFVCYVSGETLVRSCFGKAHPGKEVNLERALVYGGRIGGHLVSGHVEAVGSIERIQPSGAGAVFHFSFLEAFSPCVVEKGSLAVDGVSMTVMSRQKTGFQVSVIPETLEKTTFRLKRAGDSVNLEPDLMLKYIRSAVIEALPSSKGEGITMERLGKLGFPVG